MNTSELLALFTILRALHENIPLSVVEIPEIFIRFFVIFIRSFENNLKKIKVNRKNNEYLLHFNSDNEKFCWSTWLLITN